MQTNVGECGPTIGSATEVSKWSQLMGNGRPFLLPIDCGDLKRNSQRRLARCDGDLVS